MADPLMNTNETPNLNTPAPSVQAQPQLQNRPQGQPQPQVSPTIDARQKHENLLGKAVKSLMGTHYDYKVDPQTGQTVSVPIKEAPGQIFRHILAGAILGGAVGSSKPNLASGIAAGGTAEMEQEEKNDAERRRRATQDYQQGIEAKKEQRDTETHDAQMKGFKTEEELRKAQITLHNAQSARENQLIQGESFTLHDKMANEGKAKLQPYIEAGGTFVFKDIAESEMNDVLKNHPGFVAYDWEPTGTRVVMKDGVPTYEATYSAVDPRGKVKITPDLIKMFKDAGMDKQYPNIFDVLKPGKEISVSDYVVLKNQYQTAANDKFERDKRGLDIEGKKAQIRKENAEAAKYLAEVKDKKLETKQAQLFGEALDELNKVGGDFEKLSPKSKVVLAESSNKLIGNLNNAIKEAMNEFPPNEEKAKELMKQRDQLLGLASQAFSSIKSSNNTRNNIQLDEDSAKVYDNIQKADSKPSSYKDIENVSALKTDSQRVALAAALGVPISQDAINRMAKKVGTTPSELSKQIEAKGGKVEGSSSPVAKPFPKVTISDILNNPMLYPAGEIVSSLKSAGLKVESSIKDIIKFISSINATQKISDFTVNKVTQLIASFKGRELTSHELNEINRHYAEEFNAKHNNK